MGVRSFRVSRFWCDYFGYAGSDESYAVLSKFESDDDEIMELLGEILGDWGVIRLD